MDPASAIVVVVVVVIVVVVVMMVVEIVVVGVSAWRRSPCQCLWSASVPGSVSVSVWSASAIVVVVVVAPVVVIVVVVGRAGRRAGVSVGPWRVGRDWADRSGVRQ